MHPAPRQKCAVPVNPPSPAPAWSRPRWRRLRTRSARRSRAFWRSAICWRPPDLDERERRWVDTIKAGAEHLASLATLFVDAARSGGPGLEVRQDFFDLRTLARNAANSLTGRAAAKGLQSSVVISEKLPAFAIGDPVRLRAAVENLIDNAVKFTEQGSVTLQVTPCAARKARSPLHSRSPTAGSASRSPRSNACSGRFRRPMSPLPRASAAPGSDCRRSGNWRAPWAAMSP